jgi:hypothetical protein
MYVAAEQLINLGVSRSELRRKLSSGEWQALGVSRKRGGKFDCHILLASLPLEYQGAFLKRRAVLATEESPPPLLDLSDSVIANQERDLRASLLRIPPEERTAWLDEAIRIAKIVARYRAIRPKRKLDPETRRYRFVSEVIDLCREAACTSPTILSREPHRVDPPAPHTLDGWMRRYQAEGLLFYIPSAPTIDPNKPDCRRAVMSKGAQDWVRANWRRFKSARHLFKALERSAQEKDWVIPSYSWFYRLWGRMPAIVATSHIKGDSAYVAKYAPFVPRDYSDLQALEVLCGDHSERDVTVLLNDGTLARPWLTLWLDLRTWLIWGWHLDITPSSYSVGMAYADGVRNFGAQPLPRLEDGFQSYVYTDHGRTYKSHQWDGTVIAVHKEAMKIDGGLELLLIQRKVGILEEVAVKHLLARRWNAKEKPVERVHKDISGWEENTFAEFCGRDAKSRPDTWRNLYAQHLKFVRGERKDSPFISFDDYKEHLALFITLHNSSAHERLTLGGRSIVPTEEFSRLYTTRYEIANETLALLLMKSTKRTIEKDGVQCFQKNWFYYHESMSRFKGRAVEVRHTDDDYKRVWVILPNAEICEATLITPTSIINPNKQTLKTIKEARAHERNLIRDFDLLKHSQLRGETTEDRVMERIGAHVKRETGGMMTREYLEQAVVHKLTRMDRKKHLRVHEQSISPSEVAVTQTDESIFDTSESGYVSEFDGDIT